MRRKEKRFKIIAGLCILLIIVCSFILFCNFCYHRTETSSETTAELFAMDTYITITAYGSDAKTALPKAEKKIKELEQLWAATVPDSDIYAVNHSGGQPTKVSVETAELLSFALQMAEETDGILEPTIYPVLTAWGFTTEENRIPSNSEISSLLKNVGYERVRLDKNVVQIDNGMMLDLGAVGKGYAGDLVCQILKGEGITSVLLNLGGNIQAIGSKPDGSNWHLGLRDPYTDGALGVLEIRNQAVVTSGNYERYFVGKDGNQYGHIIDPATGHPAESGLVSATVIAEEGRLCDALSTSLFIMGLDRAIDYWQNHQNFDMILITQDGEIYLTDSIAESFTLDSHHSNMGVHVIEF